MTPLVGLAPWACDPSRSRGRRIPQESSHPRSEHQRDRDRIVHSTAFRRLVYKTQVFINHEGDLYRTRMTHSLEVAQLARSMARPLHLNEDLVEAIALAHDLGHTPFGHAGQDALQDCMKSHGGFEHNLQSLRVIDALEQRYAAFDGLNLTFETREGVLKRCSLERARSLEALEPTGVGERFLKGWQPSLEAQLVNLADELAYNAHDIDDGVRSGLITMAQLGEVPLFARLRDETLNEFPTLEHQPDRRLLFETIRRMLSTMVYDVVAHTGERLRVLNPKDVQAVRQLPPVVSASASLRSEISELKRFLFASLYRHPMVVQTTDKARVVVAELFQAYRESPSELPTEHAQRPSRYRALADYIAGMTDRFALREHERLTGRRIFAAD